MKDIELPPLPERDTAKPAEEQGVFRKFDVRRTDGSSEPGGKHHGCEYFVLDVDHDPAAHAALAAYADAIEATHPVLAADMRSRYGLSRAAVEADRAQRVPDGFALVPIEPDHALLRPFYACPRDHLALAWRAMHMVAAKKSRGLAPTPAQPAQQEPDWKDMYEKEKRRSAMWVAKYEKDIGPLEYAVPVAHQEPPQQERKPMTEDALVDGFCGARHSNQFVSVFIAGARFAERHHGIKE